MRRNGKRESMREEGRVVVRIELKGVDSWSCLKLYKISRIVEFTWTRAKLLYYIDYPWHLSHFGKRLNRLFVSLSFCLSSFSLPKDR